MNFFQKAIDYFKKPAPVAQKRSLVSALSSRLTDFSKASLITINAELLEGLLNSVKKCRFLALNSPFTRSWLSLCEKNIIGKNGFILQVQAKKSTSKLDSSLNDEIEWQWYEFGKHANGYLTVDGQMGHAELDALILRTLLVDGEVFIRVHKRPDSPYKISFEVLDTLDIDYTKIRDFAFKQNRNNAWC